VCTKGDKCKYSHDLEQARKSDKIDLYTDRREDEEENPLAADTMDNWDQQKLEQVVETKRGDNNNAKTKIVCKHFLDAVESRKYGWFWECPAGEKCQYQHCLPPGFILKVKEKAEEEEVEVVPLEVKLEEERTQLVTRTPMTLELFLKWKEDKKKEKESALADAKQKRESDIKSGKVMRSGREMFVYNPDLFVDEDDAVDISELEPEKDTNEGPIINIDVTGTSISTTITNASEGNEEGLESDNEENGSDNEEKEHEIENGKDETVGIQEDLFVEEEIPDVSDEEEN